MSNDGGPAFPDIRRLEMLRSSLIDQGTKETIFQDSSGMSLRDYFAAKAMQAMIARGHMVGNEDERRLTVFGAYAVADAMLAERAK